VGAYVSRTAKATKAGTPGRKQPAPKMLNTTKPPTRKKQSRGAERANQIMQTAESMFCEYGYSGTSMDDIAAAVGILKGSLYYYVDSKEDLLFRIVQRVHVAVSEIYEEAEARTDLPALERVVHYVRAQLHHNTEDLTALTVYHHDWQRLEGERLEQIKAERREHHARMRALLEEARAAGDIPETANLDLVLNHVFAVTVWPYTWYRPGGPFTPTELAETGAAFVRAGLSGTP